MASLRTSSRVVRLRASQEVSATDSPPTDNDDLHAFGRSIPDERVWNKLSNLTSDTAFKNVKTVKVVYSVAESAFHFLNTRHYPYHYEFCKRELKCKMKLSEFNVICYEHDDRPFILGSLSHYSDQDKYVFEMWPGDLLGPKALQSFFTSVQEKVYFGDWLCYRPCTTIQEKVGAEAQIPIITSDELFRGVKFQPLTMGYAFGEFHTFLGPASSYDLSSIQPDWIVLFEETPLSHVALLCQNRKTPNVAVKDIHLDPALNGQRVKLDVTKRNYRLKVSKDSISFMSWMKDKFTPSKTVHLSSSVEREDVLTLSEFSKNPQGIKAVKWIGSKAATLAEIGKMKLETVSDIPMKYGLAIPFYYYHSHMTPACLELVQSLKKQTGILKRSDGIIFRSSTNVEDIPGFNGAGLYLSEALPSQDCTAKKMADVIKRVWASVWNYRGYVERELFGIVQEEVKVAILVQPWFSKKVAANGVVITANPFRKDFPAFFFNTSCAGKLVTDGSGGSTPEQILVYDEGVPIPDYVSMCSDADGKLLDTHDIESLFTALMKLHEYYIRRKKLEGNCVDVEFIILDTPERDILLLQCRPLQLVR